MIKIVNKKDCCGCSACAQRCPKRCISLLEDEEGFLYPKADANACVDCGLCEKVCPVLNQDKKKRPIEVHAAFNKDENIRKSSSSGGVFSSLAEIVLKRGGIVFGAKWDEDYKVSHDYIESQSQLYQFRGSKYLQSNLKDSFKEIENFLKNDKIVLFSGTPCQVSGLKHFLRRDYENLFTIDFICHGVPSQKVFRQYMKEYEYLFRNSIAQIFPDIILDSSQPLFSTISFRDKSSGWNNYRFAAKFVDKKLSMLLPRSVNDAVHITPQYKKGKDMGNRELIKGMDKIPPFDLWSEGEHVVVSNSRTNSLFFRGYLYNLFLRPSCYECPAKDLKSGSDITLGDFWGVELTETDFGNDNQGVTAVILNSEKGGMLFNDTNVESRITKYEILKGRNSALFKSSYYNPNRSSFFKKNRSVHDRILRYARIPFRIIFVKKFYQFAHFIKTRLLFYIQK